MNISHTSSSSETDIEVYQFFVDVLEDFAEFLPEDNEPVMDKAIRDFTTGLDSLEETDNVSYSKTEDLRYSISFDFTSIHDLLKNLGQVDNQTVIEEYENGIRFYLDIDNYPELKNAIPFLADPNFEVYGPEYNIGMTEYDYYDMIYYLLGEEGPGAIQESMIRINVTTPEKIRSIRGARQTGPHSFTYEFPLIDFLLLAEPMTFEVRW